MSEIPEGFVRTYGDVSPGAPRFAGAVLFEVDDPELPWWRVVRADGSLAKGARQRRHLIAEGVPFPRRASRHGPGSSAPGGGPTYSSRGVMRKIETTSA
ncbi:MAG TPA: MGMT family protein [Solirubrobacterales bacterium]|nr:MGMT family protein [Solirubrobacterales bacterium]